MHKYTRIHVCVCGEGGYTKENKGRIQIREEYKSGNKDTGTVENVVPAGLDGSETWRVLSVDISNVIIAMSIDGPA